jgi:hypothetical protein
MEVAWRRWTVPVGCVGPMGLVWGRVPWRRTSEVQAFCCYPGGSILRLEEFARSPALPCVCWTTRHAIVLPLLHHRRFREEREWVGA